MLKIKDNIDLKELEKFGFIKEGGTRQEHYYYYWYVRFKETLFNTYEIRIDVNENREITIGRLTNRDYSYYMTNGFYRNQERVTKQKKRYVEDLIQAGLVEEVRD